ncbi:hypothetical protein [Capnocytophaga catalasegens]|uniref:Uncharacterized protein n=1 Tax=Capnocytophaga catalasegens TaxID=1004260 RepID=A0AAV5AZE1_9FLAO|nr:hypothetical protein [Capnocytophaga catalasegens]GIZ16118.1 hypothetical protein RCZ03_21180 [Capnocytophaga catalasegens]GJM51406.1 hypothetical protein RCZ15_23790 [Capnocytophaga catalasegens]GJM51790.1 hypothetical protein RCZ16_01080 [Capnocytophaga catalasegens]
MGGLNISVGRSLTYSVGQTPETDEESWYVISTSGSVGIGGGASIPGSVIGGIGKIYFINPQKVDKPKTKWETLKSYVKFIIPH